MDEKIKSKGETELDLRLIFNVIRKNLIFIIVITIVAAGLTYAYSKFFIKKQYEANAILIVNNMNSSDGKSYTTSTEINAAQSLADVYSIIIKSEQVLDPVITNLGLNTTAEVLSKQINVSSLNSTQVIKITMKNPNASYAKEVIAEIVKVAPSIIMKIVHAGSVEVVNGATISNNGSPVSPDSNKYALVGGLIGFILVMAFIFVREFTNNTFKTEDDIINTLNIPLLGIIPSVDSKEFNKSV